MNRMSFEASPRVAALATVAALAAIAMEAPAPASSQASDEAVAAMSDREAHVIDCLEDGASLPTRSLRNGERIDLRTAHSFKITMRPKSMDEIRPDCGDVDVIRDTDVVVKRNGRQIGIAHDVLNPKVDDGRNLSRILRTPKSVKAGDRITGLFTTFAQGGGLLRKETDKVSFKITR